MKNPPTGGGDGWRCRNFPGREPFLDELAEKVRITGHMPHICRMLSDFDGCTIYVPLYSPVTELLLLFCNPVARQNKISCQVMMFS